MGKNKKTVPNIEDRSRYVKLMLYPDNPVHKFLIDRILSHDLTLFEKTTVWSYIGIIHNPNSEIEDIKTHYHIYLSFVNPMAIKSLCRRFGFFTDAGDLDDQFVRVISGKMEDAMPYLTHLNAPEKELYPDSALFGDSSLIADYHKFALKYLSKKIDKRDAFKQASDWISAQQGIISAKDMVQFLITHECFVIRHESWLRSMWFEHNSRLAYLARKEVTDQICRNAEKWAEILAGVDEKIYPDEWFELNEGKIY